MYGEAGAGKESLAGSSLLADLLPQKLTALVLASTLALAGTSDSAAARSGPSPAKSVPALNGEIRELGVAVEAEDLNDSEHAAFLAKNFKVLVPENEAKSSVIMPRSRWNRDYSGLDKIVHFASKHNLKVRGHPLVFGGQQDPAWINRIGGRCGTSGLLARPISEAARIEMNEVFHDHIKSLSERHTGEINEWDVINEPLNRDGTLANNAYYRCFGKDYIPRAFKLAHAANKNAKLYLNEINAERPGLKRDGLIKLASELLEQKVPLYGIGLQTHVGLDFDIKEFKETLRIFRGMGLAVKLTEMDVSIGKNPTKEQYAKQQQIFVSIIKACTEEKACVGALIWGATDAYEHTWLDASGTLFYPDKTPKPAYGKIITMLKKSNKPQIRTELKR